MSSKLPLLAPHATAHTFCAYCPKMCRFACPVSTVQGRETTTPWGKMHALHRVDRGDLPLDETYSRPFYACSGCMRCRSACDHGIEVAAALYAGRAETHRAGLSPPAASEVIARFAEREHRAMATWRDAAPAARGERSTAFFPGCTAACLATESALGTIRLVEHLAETTVAGILPGCCGLPLLEAGDPAGFVRTATELLERLAPYPHVVFQDPGCLHALTRLGSTMGVIERTGLEHVASLAARQRHRLRGTGQGALVRYHDACRLGRGLGLYDEPRLALAAATGRAPLEFDHARQHAYCSGGGGQLPRTDLATANAIAAECAADHCEPAAELVVTGCPGACHRLRSQEIRCEDLGAFLAAACGL